MLLTLLACGPSFDAWLDDATLPLPDRLSDLGDLDEEATSSAPAYPLWTNGSDKSRWLALPEGGQIDNSSEHWSFPDGSMLFKEFRFGVVVETRVLRAVAGGWDYAVYIQEGDVASLWNDKVQLPVAVEVEGQPFDHVVPNRLDCRSCHEAHPTGVIGASDLQLADSLDQLDGAGLLAYPPAESEPIVDEDPLLEALKRYALGNCVHCHDGRNGENNAYDLSPDVFVENTVDRATEGLASAAGIRVVPGSPEESVLFAAMSGETDDPEVKPMPPLGVQRLDTEAIALLRTWIESLE